MISNFSRKVTSLSVDVLVIGAGPGGYASAIRSGQLGLKTVCVEKEKLLGGTCLREGCIPSKFLLNVSRKFYETNNDIRKYGISLESKAKVDLNSVHHIKESIMDTNSQGLEFLMSKYNVKLEKGFAFIHDPENIVVRKSGSDDVIYHPKHLILATGTDVFSPEDYKIDEELVVSSRGALQFRKVPKKLFVIGAGIIGLELSSVWSELGSKVTVCDIATSICSNALDKDISNILKSSMEKRGVNFILGKKPSIFKKNGYVEVKIEDKVFNYDNVLVAIGRKPMLKGFGFENLGVKLNKKGSIIVDKKYQTNIPRVYAIGDIISGPQLAHKAEEEGITCIEMINGRKSGINYNTIPSVIYTHPEVAHIGHTERELKMKGIKFNKKFYRYPSNSFSKVNFQNDGFIKVIRSLEEKTLGLDIIGENAGEIISQNGLLMKIN